MKKIVVITSVLFVASLSIISCKQGSTPNTAASSPKDNSATNVPSDNIVYVNADSLTANYQYFKDIRAKYDAKGKKAEADLGVKGQSFQKEVGAYQQQANTLTAEQRAQTEQRLQRKQQELQALQQKTGAALQQEQAKDQEAIYSTVETYLKKYAKSKGYKLVLTYQRGVGQILFADESLDITKNVLKDLNADYKPAK